MNKKAAENQKWVDVDILKKYVRGMTNSFLAFFSHYFEVALGILTIWASFETMIIFMPKDSEFVEIVELTEFVTFFIVYIYIASDLIAYFRKRSKNHDRVNGNPTPIFVT